jgi:hypothetical protein
MNDIEVKVMGELAVALSKLEDKPDAQKRALKWLCERFDFEIKNQSVNHANKNDKSSIVADLATTAPSSTSNEMPGIACLTSDGEYRVTMRDLKAKNKLDAANRLVHVCIYSYTQMQNLPDMPSRLLTSILKDWRVYDGNTRVLISKSKGLIRTKEGGLALDAHAKRDALKYIAEILNDEIAGKWSAT